MNDETRAYGRGTALTMRYPFATYVAGRALCSDGKVRALKRIAVTADTFFSVPAAVRVNGRTVGGYVTFEDDADGERVVLFRAYTYGRNGALLPQKTNSEMLASAA